MKTNPHDPAFCEVNANNLFSEGKPTGYQINAFGGLTKKEYFTAVAVQGLLAASFGSVISKSLSVGETKVNINTSQVAIAAVKIAEKTIEMLNISEEVKNEQTKA